MILYRIFAELVLYGIPFKADTLSVPLYRTGWRKINVEDPVPLSKRRSLRPIIGPSCYIYDAFTVGEFFDTLSHLRLNICNRRKLPTCKIHNAHIYMPNKVKSFSSRVPTGSIFTTRLITRFLRHIGSKSLLPHRPNHSCLWISGEMGSCPLETIFLICKIKKISTSFFIYLCIVQKILSMYPL